MPACSREARSCSPTELNEFIRTQGMKFQHRFNFEKCTKKRFELQIINVRVKTIFLCALAKSLILRSRTHDIGSMMKQKLTREDTVFVLILAAGAVVRFWNIDWGLPGLFEEAT